MKIASFSRVRNEIRICNDVLIIFIFESQTGVCHLGAGRQERQPEIQLNSMQLTSLTLELLFHYSLGITHFERLAIFMYRNRRYIIEHGISKKPIAYRL